MLAPVSSSKVTQPTTSTTTSSTSTSTADTTKASTKTSPTDSYSLNRARSAGEEIPQTCITRSAGEEIPQTCAVGGVSSFSLTSADFSAK